jgi:hypothetical protein
LVNGKAIQTAIQTGQRMSQSVLTQGRSRLGMVTAGGDRSVLGSFEPRVFNGRVGKTGKSSTAGTGVKAPEKGEHWASGAYSASSADVQPRHMTKLEHALAFKNKGNPKQAAKYVQQLKEEMGPERYAALKRAYLQQTPKGSALTGNTLKGDSYRVSEKHIDLMKPSDKFSRNAQLREPLKGHFDVIAHGVEQPGLPTTKIRLQTLGRDVEIDHRVLAKLLRTQKNYNGEAVRLLSCSTGNESNCFARNLANKMNKKVLAPSDTIWAGEKSGEIVISPMEITTDPLTGKVIERKPQKPYTGEWRTFNQKEQNNSTNSEHTDPVFMGRSYNTTSFERKTTRDLYKLKRHQERLLDYQYDSKGRTANQLTEDVKSKLRTGENKAQMQQRVQKAQAEMDARRMTQLENEGHGPQRHGPQVTEQQLDNRTMYSIDPVSGTKYDAYLKNPDGTPRLHKSGKNATNVTSIEAYVRGEKFLRSSQQFREALKDNTLDRIVVQVSLQEIYGSNYTSHVFGKTRIGSAKNPQGTVETDFLNGTMKGVYIKNQQEGWNLHTMYPEPKK